MKNYPWSTVSFPITASDVIDGRCHHFLSAIRKLIFLIQNPAAGYYKEDYPSAVYINGNWVDNSANGLLPVYDSGNIITGATSRSYATWCAESPQTETLAQIGHFQHEKGSIRIWCNGVIYADNTESAWIAGSGDHPWLNDEILPPVNGWFDDDNSQWIKQASKNRYYEWDANTFRKITGGLTRDYGDIPLTITEGWSIDANLYLPKQFDPYEQLPPLYAVEGLYRYADIEADETGKYVYSNLWYSWNNDAEIWSPTSNGYHDDPSVANGWVRRYPTLDLAKYLFQKTDVFISKHQFSKEDIQGPLYGSSDLTLDHPQRWQSQYTKYPSLPTASSSYYTQNLKMTECIMAYIEGIFDANFCSEVDSTFKTNYHDMCGGVYNGYAYDSFDAAALAGVVSIIQPITDMAWGCNGSGFEWAVKKSGNYAFAYITANPYFHDTTPMEEYITANISEPDRSTMIGLLGQFVGNIKGTVRYTWKHSFAKPQESTSIQTSAYEPPGSFFYGLNYFVNSPLTTIEQWYSQAIMNAATYSFGGSSYIGAVSNMDANDAAASINMEPTQTIGGAREYEITKLVAILNNIWDVLTVQLGYAGTYSGLSISSSRPYHTGLGIDNIATLTRLLAIDRANYKTETYNTSLDAGICRYGIHQVITGAGEFTEASQYILKIVLAGSGLNITPTSEMSIDIKAEWDYGTPDWTNGTPLYIEDYPGFPDAFVSSSLRALGGNFPLSISVAAPDLILDDGEWFGELTASVPVVQTLKFNPEQLVSDLVGWFVASPGMPTKVLVYAYGTTYRYYLYSGIKLTSLPTKQILMKYNWDVVPERVWYRDGNHPKYVASFVALTKPPYPNPSSWIIEPALTEQDETWLLSGSIFSCTSIPSGRTVKYKFKLLTDFDLIDDNLIPTYDDQSTYIPADSVEFDGYIYSALQNVPALKYPEESPTYWSLLGPAKGWSGLLVDPTSYDYTDQHILDNVLQEDPYYAIELRKTKVIQKYLWYYNLSKWYAVGTADDGIEVYDIGTIASTSSEITIPESFDLGILITRWYNGTTSVYDLTYTADFVGNGLIPEYDSGVYYLVDHVVAYQGRHYICIQDANGIVPTNASYFTERKDMGLDNLRYLFDWDAGTDVKWGNWTKTISYLLSDNTTTPIYTISAEDYDSLIGLKIRITIVMTLGALTHTFKGGWISIIPPEGLVFP